MPHFDKFKNEIKKNFAKKLLKIADNVGNDALEFTHTSKTKGCVHIFVAHGHLINLLFQSFEFTSRYSCIPV